MVITQAGTRPAPTLSAQQLIIWGGNGIPPYTFKIYIISLTISYLLSKIPFTNPLSIKVPKTFFKIIKIIGPKSNPITPITL